jgi:biopolymer transport protein ExbD
MEASRRLFEIKDPIVSINVTPLVDVSLVLVIIFMIFAPLQLQTGLIVKNAANTQNKVARPLPENLILEVSNQGFRLNTQPIEEAQLPYRLAEVFGVNSEIPLLVLPEDEVRHERLIAVLDLAKAAGAGKLVLGQKTALGRSPIHGQ